jgi:hypothetical protein
MPITVNAIIWLLLSDWQSPGHSSNKSNKNVIIIAEHSATGLVYSKERLIILQATLCDYFA